MNTYLSENQIKYQLSNLRQITFEVTDACNLRCKYCGYGEFYKDCSKRNFMKKLAHFLFGSVLFLLLVPSCTTKKSNSELASVLEEVEMDSVIIPFTLKDDRILLKGEINGSVYNFLLDNCCPRNEIDKSIFYSHYDTAKLTRLVSPRKGVEVFAYPFKIHLAQYNFEFDSIRVEKIDRRIKRDGTIGTEFFLNTIIEIDFKNLVIIRRNILPKNVQKEYFCLELLKPDTIILGTEYLIRWAKIPSFLNKDNKEVSGVFVADLGNQYQTLMNSFYKKIDINLSKKDSTSFTYTFLSAEPLLIEGVNLFFTVFNEDGNETSEQINGYDRYIRKDGLMGVSFLKQFNVIFDYPNNKLYLKKYD